MTHKRSVCSKGRGSHVTITHDALDLTIQGPPPGLPPPYRDPVSDIWWPRLKTCSNLFTWGPPTTVNWHLVATEEARTVASRAARILVECFLVKIINCWFWRCYSDGGSWRRWRHDPEDGSLWGRERDERGREGVPNPPEVRSETTSGKNYFRWRTFQTTHILYLLSTASQI